MATSETDDLKSLALSIVRSQSNVYIKELLRERGVRIGSTKQEFDQHLTDAIETGVLTKQLIEDWLKGVEGWGQQHVYAYRLTPELSRAFGSAAKARSAVKKAKLDQFWGSSTTDRDAVWPAGEGLNLVAITYEESLRLHWHKGTQYWIRGREEAQHDKPNEWIDGFEYQFRAYRGQSLREVMRFEIRPRDQMAALFIPKPIGSTEHKAAYAAARATMGMILDLTALEKNHLRVGAIIRNFDQALTFGKADGVASPQSTRLRSGTAYVEFGALGTEGSFLDSNSVGDLRKTIRTPQEIAAYDGTAGKFRFPSGRVELSAADNRIRLWSSLTADLVWEILRTLSAYESAGS